MRSAELPDPLFSYLADLYIHQASPAWIRLDSDCRCIAEAGGSWPRYLDKPKLNPGSELEEHFIVLCGQSFDQPFVLPQIELQDGHYTDIHHTLIDGVSWLLFLDVTEQVSAQQLQQQNANELSLLKDRQKQTLDRYMGATIAELSVGGKLTFNASGERRQITTMFIDLRSFTLFNEAYDPQHVMDTLNHYMTKMIPPILEEHGLIDKITGDGAMAVFGVQQRHAPAESALRAACKIQCDVADLNRSRREQGEYVMEVGVGIASGEAVLGILGAHDRRAFTAIGPHVNLAARLESIAKGGEILVDSATFKATSHLISSHQQMEIELKGIGLTPVYNLQTY
ncbi:adenylate/guanylate cyclase domain-containing protein [Mariprofundus sp. KV]|uniref:adenylate/guanylate cyclase domain-containing protein n=1 Tax=Mariprofundus sp. KV TaxID=2608715 RepID=UPI0015A366ED|nr:adenylate/guanylate cyclase domain-containing protein [Mariprofundus sp. KV]NWF36480.1 adenylate/guanylate cyclase domain-containing protein [Mariprofundus sp. KV]